MPAHSGCRGPLLGPTAWSTFPSETGWEGRKGRRCPHHCHAQAGPQQGVRRGPEAGSVVLLCLPGGGLKPGAVVGPRAGGVNRLDMAPWSLGGSVFANIFHIR